MKLSDEAESPVKGGFGSHQKDRLKRAPKVVASKTRVPLKKKASESKKTTAEWVGPVEPEEEEEPEPVKNNTIVIPTNVPVKAIPAALQRRMIEADRISEL